jgi:uncharacterized protein HemX
MEESNKAQGELQKALKRLVMATVALYVALAAIGAYFYHTDQVQERALARTASETATALCTLRRDLEDRVANTREFLRENPEGTPGLPAQFIKTSIENQQRTIDALGNLDC